MLKPMINAFSNLFSKPATIDYPFEKSPQNKEARGLIVYDEQKCIFCLRCEDVCPPEAIAFTQNREDFSYTYLYNPYLCIYCGECVRVCPDKAEALTQSCDFAPPCSEQDMNDKWFDIQKEAKESKEECKILKKAQKNSTAETDNG
jgi:NADH-quinone oxidoreductase subunit I